MKGRTMGMGENGKSLGIFLLWFQVENGLVTGRSIKTSHGCILSCHVGFFALVWTIRLIPASRKFNETTDSKTCSQAVTPCHHHRFQVTCILHRDSPLLVLPVLSSGCPTSPKRAMRCLRYSVALIHKTLLL